MKNQTNEYSQALLKLILKYVAEVKDQNTKYFESRALQLIHKEKNNRLITIQLNIIMKSLQMTREELLMKEHK